MNKWIMLGIVVVVGWFLWSKFGGKITAAVKP